MKLIVHLSFTRMLTVLFIDDHQASELKKRRQQLYEEEEDIQRGLEVCVCVCECV